MCTVRSLELVVKTYEKTKLSCVLTELDSIARTVCKVPENSWLYIKLPISLLTEVVSESKTSLSCQLCIITSVISLNDVLVTVSDPVTDTCLSTYLETTIWVVLAEKVCEVDSTIQTEVDGTNNCVTVRET